MAFVQRVRHPSSKELVLIPEGWKGERGEKKGPWCSNNSGGVCWCWVLEKHARTVRGQPVRASDRKAKEAVIQEHR